MSELRDNIDVELYYREATPYATVCMVLMKDGRVGAGLYRCDEDSCTQEHADQMALANALLHLHDVKGARQAAYDALVKNGDLLPDSPDNDLQASLGHPAHQ